MTHTEAASLNPAPALSAPEHAALLAQMLPPLRRTHGKTVLIKYGGNAMTEPALQRAFAEDVVLLHRLGLRPVVVHGGGPQIENLLQRLGLQGRFVQGMRVTDEATMQVVEWVLAGQVQPELVGLIHAAGGRAVGLSGRDANLISARPLRLPDAQDPTRTHDLGLVGEIVGVDVRVLHELLAQGCIPVVSPIGADAEQAGSRRYNINADVVAARLAVALQAEKLLMLSNIPGVLDRQGQLLPRLSLAQIEGLVADGTISGGMIPKLAGAVEAAQAGVQAVHIIDGRMAHALLLELLSERPCGTTIRA